MAGEHFGVSYEKPSGKPREKVLTGHFGISFSPSGTKPVSVKDKNGKPLQGVRITANNAIAGTKTAITDQFGGAPIYMEDNTSVEFRKDDFTFTKQFTAGKRLAVTIDLPFLT